MKRRPLPQQLTTMMGLGFWAWPETLLPPRRLSPFRPESREKRIGDMNFKVFWPLTTHLANKHMAVNHGPEEQRDSNLGIETAAEKASLLSTLDQIGKGHTGRLDNPRPPNGTDRPIA